MRASHAEGRTFARTRTSIGQQDGISLIEVLMAAAVLGIATLGLAVMFSSGVGMVSSEGGERVELYLAEQKLESLRASGFNSAAIGTATETVTGGQWAQNQAVNSFLLVTTVTYVDRNTLLTSGTPTNTKRVTVTATPTARHADYESVTVEGILVN